MHAARGGVRVRPRPPVRGVVGRLDLAVRLPQVPISRGRVLAPLRRVGKELAHVALTGVLTGPDQQRVGPALVTRRPRIATVEALARDGPASPGFRELCLRGSMTELLRYAHGTRSIKIDRYSAETCIAYVIW